MNCQVGSAFHLRVRFLTLVPCSLAGHCPKPFITLQVVGNLQVLAFEGKTLNCIFLGRCLRGPCRRFPLNYDSHVRLLPIFRARAIFPKPSAHWDIQNRHLEQK